MVTIDGGKLQIAAVRAGLYTRTDLAKAAGISVPTVAKVCNGWGTTVQIGTLGKLAKACGVDPADLLADKS